MFSVTASPTAAVARAPPSRRARRVAARASAEPSDVSTASTASTASPATDRVTLGTSDLSVSATGVGAWAWGDRSGYWTDDWKGQRVENLEAYKTLLRSGVDFIDTAEVYGFGKSEELLAEFAKDVAGETDLAAPALATKFAPIPFRWSAEDVPRALEASLKRLGAKKTALYMQHWPAFGFGADGCNERFLEGLCLCYERGLCDAVGVSNFNADRVKAAARVFKARGVPFASNQIQYSLVYRAPELDTGVIEACREHGVTPVAYSPMAQGLLTGKYSASASAQSVKGPRGGIFTESRLSDVDGLIQTLREVGDVHGKTPAQVAVNWCMAKGTVPIPGAKNASQAASVAGCLGWRVSEAEMQALEKAAAMAPKSPGAPFEKW
jgi:aryl-alcohol dehydrogenase-like predicted oxidoreductase